MDVAGLPYDCGTVVIGRVNRNDRYLSEEEKTELYDIYIKTIKQNKSNRMICTALLSQEVLRKALLDSGFHKSPEMESNYDKDNPIAVFSYGKPHKEK